jgi:hypothetical protein
LPKFGTKEYIRTHVLLSLPPQDGIVSVIQKSNYLNYLCVSTREPNSGETYSAWPSQAKK